MERMQNKMMVLLWIVIGLFSAVSARHLQEYNLDVDLGNLPMQNPDLFGGDMLGVELDDDRTAIRGMNNRWKNKMAFYYLSKDLEQYRDLIKSAMEEYHQKTCFRFYPWNENSNYILIFAGDGCYSQVGMAGGQQLLSLGTGCMHKHIILHELGHALGFFHEHMRTDRNDYINIYWDNIKSGMEHQFYKVKHWTEMRLTPFDYDSIMLYGNLTFSKDGKSPTMLSKTGVPLLDILDKPGLSRDDIERVNMMYCRG